MSISKKKDKHHGERGQTLNEAIIAVSLLTFGVIGMLGGVVRSLSQTGIIAERMTATFLAAEGVEIAKNIVDARSMKSSRSGTDPGGSRWKDDFASGRWYDELDFYDQDTSSDTSLRKYKTRSSLDDFTEAEIEAFPVLKLDSSSNIFSYNSNSGENTSFRRITGTTSVNNQHLLVRSRVYWRAKNGKLYSVTAETNLLNWR